MSRSPFSHYTAVLLAAGCGSRIRSKTNEPKSLLKLNGESILERHLSCWKELGIGSANLVLGYQSHMIEERANPFSEAINISYYKNSDYKIYGNTYSWMLGIERAKGPVLIFDADLVYDSAVLQDLLESSYEDQIVVGSTPIEDIECTKALVDANGHIRKVVDKRAVTAEELKQYRYAGEAMGILKFSEKALQTMKPMIQRFLSDEKKLGLNWEYFLNEFLPQYPVASHACRRGRWIEIDTPEDYSRAEELFQSKE